MQLWTTIGHIIQLKSAGTQKNYPPILKVWCAFLGAPYDTPEGSLLFRAAGPKEALAFICLLRNRVDAKGERLADGTVKNYYSRLRTIYDGLIHLEIITRNPFAQIRPLISWRQKRQKRPTKLVPFDLVERILDAPSPHTKEGIRDRAILAAFFAGGLRRIEVNRLNVGDLMLTPNGVPFIPILGAKSGSNQEQPLPEWAVERLARLISQRKAEGADAGDPLFCFYYRDGRPRGRLSYKTLYNLYRRWLAVCGLDGYAPHSARATAASYLMQCGAHDREVQRFLRHECEGMVRVYDRRIKTIEENPGRGLHYPEGKKRSGTG